MAAVPVQIEVVLFDLGGTLVDSRDFFGWAEDACALGLRTDPEAIAHAWTESEPWVNHREDSPETLWREVLTRASTTEVSAATVASFLTRQASKPIHGALFSDVRRCLARLRGSGKRLGIVSNSRSEPAVRALVDRVGIGPYFESIVSSGTEGVRKPAPAIFNRALQRMRVDPRATLFVGDDPENDVRGPTGVGIHAVLLNRFGTGTDVGRPEILSLSEVPRIVRLIEAGAPVK
jgi:putative hydrolase of the HAD superfamily